MMDEKTKKEMEAMMKKRMKKKTGTKEDDMEHSPKEKLAEMMAKKHK